MDHTKAPNEKTRDAKNEALYKESLRTGIPMDDEFLIMAEALMKFDPGGKHMPKPRKRKEG